MTQSREGTLQESMNDNSTYLSCCAESLSGLEPVLPCLVPSAVWICTEPFGLIILADWKIATFYLNLLACVLVVCEWDLLDCSCMPLGVGTIALFQLLLNALASETLNCLGLGGGQNTRLHHLQWLLSLLHLAMFCHSDSWQRNGPSQLCFHLLQNSPDMTSWKRGSYGTSIPSVLSQSTV